MDGGFLVLTSGLLQCYNHHMRHMQDVDVHIYLGHLPQTSPRPNIHEHLFFSWIRVYLEALTSANIQLDISVYNGLEESIIVPRGSVLELLCWL